MKRIIQFVIAICCMFQTNTALAQDSDIYFECGSVSFDDKFGLRKTYFNITYFSKHNSGIIQAAFMGSNDKFVNSFEYFYSGQPFAMNTKFNLMNIRGVVVATFYVRHISDDSYEIVLNHMDVTLNHFREKTFAGCKKYVHFQLR